MTKKEEDIAKKIGNKIRKFRTLKGLNQEEVAKKLGMTFGNFGKIERGEINLTPGSIVELAKIFGVKPGEFFEEETKKEETAYATKKDILAINLVLKNLTKQLKELNNKK